MQFPKWIKMCKAALFQVFLSLEPPWKVGRRDSTLNWGAKSRFFVAIPRASQKRDASNCNSNRASSTKAQVSRVEYLDTTKVFCRIGSMMFYVNYIELRWAKLPHFQFQAFWFNVGLFVVLFVNLESLWCLYAIAAKEETLICACKCPANKQHHSNSLKKDFAITLW